MLVRRMLRGLVLPLLSVLFVAGCGDSREFTVGVVRPLTVISLSPSGDFPSGGADNVARDTVLVVQFSDHVREATLTGDNLKLRQGETEIDVEIAYDAETFTATLTPASHLAFSTEYEVQVLKGIKRVSDDAILAQEIHQAFKTEDPPALSITSISPGPGSIAAGTYTDEAGEPEPYGAFVTLDVVLTFSEGVSEESVTVDTLKLVRLSDDVELAGTFTLASSDEQFRNDFDEPLRTNDIVIFTPDEPLALSEKFEVRVVSGVDGLRSARATAEGGWIEPAEQAFGFETAHPATLSLVQASPSDLGIDIGKVVVDVAGVWLPDYYGGGVSTPIVLRFSESVSTVTFESLVKVYEADALGDSTGVEVPGTWSASSATGGTLPWAVSDIMTFVPDAPWQLSRNYVVEIPAGVESYRATGLAGQIGRDLLVRWDASDALPLFVDQAFPGAGAKLGRTYVDDSAFGGTDNGNTASTEIKLWFSEAISTPTLEANFTLRKFGSSVPIAGAFAYDMAGTEVTFTPSVGLDLSSVYVVEVAGGSQLDPFAGVVSLRGAATETHYSADDDFGGYLEDGFSFHFATPAPDALTVLSVTPTHGADNVARDSNLRITLSERLDAAVAASIGSYIGLAGPSGAVAFSASVTSYSTVSVVTVDPTAEFDYSAGYTLTLAGGSSGIRSWRATAEAGWLLPATPTFTFKTVDPKTLSIIAMSPTAQQMSVGTAIDDLSADFTVQIAFSERIQQAGLESLLRLEECTDANCTTIASTLAGTFSYAPDTAVEGGPQIAYFFPATGTVKYETYYRVTLPGGTPLSAGTSICAVNATEEGGCLETTWTSTFQTRKAPPLEVIATEPVNGAFPVSILRKEFSFRFSLPVSVPTLGAISVTNTTTGAVMTYGDNGDPSLNSVTFPDCSNPPTPDPTYDHYDCATQTAVIVREVALGDLDPDTTYRMQVDLSIRSTDDRTLQQEFAASFRTQPATLVWATDPESDETDVEVTLAKRASTGAITVVFNELMDTATINTATVGVTYSTARGDVRLFAVDVTTYTTSGGARTAAVFTPDLTSCEPSAQPLLYSTTYWITLDSTIANQAATKTLGADLTFAFDTVSDPVVSSVESIALRYDGSEIVTDLLAGADRGDVSITTAIRVGFGAVIDPATIVVSTPADPAGDTVLVRNIDLGTYVDLGVPAQTGPTTWEFTPLANLAYGTNYEIELRARDTFAGTPGIVDEDGNPLSVDVVGTLKTSPETIIAIRPNGGTGTNEPPTVLPIVTFSRPMDGDSLNGTTVKLYRDSDSKDHPSLYLPDEAARGVTLLPVPETTGGDAYYVQVRVGAAGILDSRGNPVATASGVCKIAGNYVCAAFGTSNAGSRPAANYSTDTFLASGSTVVSGKQAIYVEFVSPHIIPNTLTAQSFRIVDNTASEVPGTRYYDESTFRAYFVPSGYWEVGQTYTLSLNDDITSIYRQGCGDCATRGGAGATVNFTAENVAPSVMMAAPWGATGIGYEMPITITFSEAMRSESVDASTFVVTYANGGTQVTGTYTVSGTVATFTPDKPWRNATDYNWSLTTGVTDLAGNPLTLNALSTGTFTTESSALTLSSVTPATVNPATSLVFTFNKSIDAASAYPSRLGWSGAAHEIVPGSLRVYEDTANPADLTDVSKEVMGCVWVNGAVATFEPLGVYGNDGSLLYTDLNVGTGYLARVYEDVNGFTGVTDLGLLPLDPVSAANPTAFTVVP